MAPKVLIVGSIILPNKVIEPLNVFLPLVFSPSVALQHISSNISAKEIAEYQFSVLRDSSIEFSQTFHHLSLSLEGSRPINGLSNGWP